MSRRQLHLVCFTSCLGALALLPALIDRPVYQLALSSEQWVADANFFGYGKAGPRDLPRSIAPPQTSGSGITILSRPASPPRGWKVCHSCSKKRLFSFL